MLRGTVHVALAAALASTLLLSACASERPAATTAAPVPSTTTSAPVFATKEEALAAAEKVYRRYLEVTGHLAAHPSTADANDLEEIVDKDDIESERATLRRLAKDGLRASGEVRLVSFRPQSVDRYSGAVAAYVCLDYSDITIFDAHGASRKASKATSSLVATFDRQESNSIFTGQTVYEGGSLC